MSFSIAHLEDLQNQTIIFDNHSTTLCEGASIITTRQRTCLSAFARVKIMSKNIEGKVVVIAGESLGLGEATARLLCA